MGKRIASITGIVLFNVVLLVILLEIGLRLAAPSLPGALGVAARQVTTGQMFPEEWTPAWQQNRDHYYALRPGIQGETQYGSPSVSFELSTIELWEGGGIGFRTDPVDFFVDAVVVGDSFGLCFTERADCWVDRLAAAADLGIVNLSQPVTGSTSHYRILRDFGAPLTPPLVLWQFFGNDFNDDYGLAVFRGEIEPVADEAADVPADRGGPAAWLRQHSAAYAVVETALTGRVMHAAAGEALFQEPHRVTYGPEGEHTLLFGAAYEQGALDMTREANQIGLEYSRRALRDARDLTAEWDGEIVVIVIPTREEVYADLTAPVLGQEAIDRLASAREAMFDLCAELDLRCYDPLPALTSRAREGEALYHVDDMHLNAHGNAALAAALADYLRDQGLLEPDETP